MKSKINNKFYSIYNTFTEKEKKEFYEFLNISFIKKPRQFEISLKLLESGKEFHSVIEKKYSERSLWNIYSELKISLDQFLAIKEITGNPEEVKKFARAQYKERGLSDLIVSDLKSVIKNKKSSEISYDTFKDIHLASLEYAKTLSKTGIHKDAYKIDNVNTDFHLLSFFFEVLVSMIEKEIRMSFYGENSRSFLNEIPEIINIKKTLKLIESYYPEYEFIFKILYYFYSAAEDPMDFESFCKARDLFFLNLSRFSEKLKIDFYYIILNINIYISQKTNRNLDFEMFEIFKSKLENGLFEDLKSSKIGGNHFRDYVYIALNVNEDVWAEDFIKKYSNYLPEELKENNINTALAFLNLKRKKYDDAVKFIKRLNRNFHIHDLDFYTVQIFASYDSGNIIECLRLKKSFREYLKNNTRFPKNIKTGPENFLKILKILINYKETGNKNLINEIEFIIENTKEIYWKVWINEKIAEAKREVNQP